MNNHRLFYDASAVPTFLKRINDGLVTEKEIKAHFRAHESHPGSYLAVLCEESLPDVLIDFFLEQGSAEKRFFLMGCPNLRIEHYRSLMKNAPIHERLRLLRNPNIPVEFLFELLKKKSLGKREKSACAVMLRSKHPDYGDWPEEWIVESFTS